MTSAVPPEPGPTDTGRSPRPTVALRVVVTYDGSTRRVDLELGGVESVMVEDGIAAPFPTEQLWPTIRELLPPLDHLRADPRGATTHEERGPGPTFAADCVASVVIATVVGEGEQVGSVAVRSWLATPTELWSVTQHGDGTTTVAAAPDGAVADLVIWDVTGALETLVRVLEEAS